MLTNCKQEKEIRTTELQKGCRHICKQTEAALNQFMFVSALMVQCGLVVSPTGNPVPGFSVLPYTCCSILNGLGLDGFGQGFLI